MKKLFFLLLVLPLHLFAQKADSLGANSAIVTDDKLNAWFRNTYNAKNSEPVLGRQTSLKPTSKQIARYRPIPDMFLYSPYLYSNRPFSTTANLTNTPYYSGYLDQTGGATIGQVLLAGGINYLVDKAIAGKEKKSKKK